MKVLNIFHKSLSAKLMLLFIIVSLLPISIIGIIMGRDSMKVTKDEAFIKLEAIGILKKKQILNYFSERKKDIVMLSEYPEIINFPKKMKKITGNNKNEVTDVITTSEYKKFIKPIDLFLKNFADKCGFSDLSILDKTGNVIYSIAQNKDWGTNVFDGIYKETSLGTAVKNADKNMGVTLSDFEKYEAANKAPVGFLANVLTDIDNKTIGYLAAQIPIDQINVIMQENTGLGKSGKTYIVGQDYLMRNDSGFGSTSTIFRKEVRTAATEELIGGYTTDHHSKAPHSKVHTSIIDIDGVSVLSYRCLLGLDELMHTDFDWVMMAELETDEAFALSANQIKTFSIVAVILSILVLLLGYFFSKLISNPINELTASAKAVSSGNLERKIQIKLQDEIGVLAESFREMTNSLRKSTANKELQSWFNSGKNALSETISGDKDATELAKTTITFLAKYLDAQIGAIYLTKAGKDELVLAGSYAFQNRKNLNSAIKFGEGLVGQSAYEKEMIILTNIPDDYIKINSALGEAVPKNILVSPIILEGNVLGVIELGSIYEFTDGQKKFIHSAAGSIAVAVNSTNSREKVRLLLERTQQQAKEMQTQQEELRAINEELQEQTEELQAQEEELRATNEELQEQTEELQAQEEELRATNDELQEQTEEMQAQEEELRATNDELSNKTEYLEQQSLEISEQKRLLEISKSELEKKAEDLIIAGEYKSEFLANMSHELRTPMNGVIGMTGLLLETKLSDEQLDFVETIKLSGDSLLTIINDILDFSKIESGKMDLEEAPFEIHSCIEETFDLIYPKAKEKKIELNYFIDPEIPHTITGDITRVRQILVNLAGNSIKFTEKGEIYISVEKKESTDGNIMLQFGVKDTGIGIPKDRINSLFNAFTQADSSTTRRFGGTGLGLAICSKLAELMNGKIWVESVFGEGSTFFFTIITKPAELKEIEYLEDDIPDLKEKRVLIVDDENTNRKILKLQCEHWGLESVIACSPKEALSLAKESGKFDLALIDYQLPEMTGLKLGAKLKEKYNFPIILLSSYDKPEDPENYEDAFNSILTKPVKKSQLFDAVISSLTKRVKAKKLPKQLQLDAHLAEQIPIKILLAEDNVINQKLAMKIFSKMGYKIDVAVNGLEAIELFKKDNHDIIFMDVQMPKMDGLEATKKLKKQYLGESSPIIIAMTANALQGDKEKCLEAGMNDFISKPIKITALQDSIIKWGSGEDILLASE